MHCTAVTQCCSQNLLHWHREVTGKLGKLVAVSTRATLAGHGTAVCVNRCEGKLEQSWETKFCKTLNLSSATHAHSPVLQETSSEELGNKIQRTLKCGLSHTWVFTAREQQSVDGRFDDESSLTLHQSYHAGCPNAVM